MIDSFELVFFTVGFLVPGFVWSLVLSLLAPTRSASPQVRLLEFLTLSCINHGLWSWALLPIFLNGFVGNHPVLSGWAFFGIIFISPIILGIVSGRLLRTDLVARFVSGLGLRMIHWTPRAWDWYFSRSKPCWALVTLNNVAHVYGLFHPAIRTGRICFSRRSSDFCRRANGRRWTTLRAC